MSQMEKLRFNKVKGLTEVLQLVSKLMCPPVSLTPEPVTSPLRKMIEKEPFPSGVGATLPEERLGSLAP